MTTKIALIAGAAIASTAAAQDLLIVDLTVADTITISSGGGAAIASNVGSDFTGVLLENFFGGPIASGLLSTLVSGDLNSFADGNASDGTPALFGATGNAGLNIWSFSDGTPEYVAGVQAFTGSATWTLDSAVYDAVFALGNRSGDIYSPADTDDDIAGAVNIGSYRVVVPAPSAMALLGLGGLVAGRRRR